MKAAHPYLNFAGNSEDAFNFYKSVFGGEFQALMRFRDFGQDAMGVPEAERDKIAHIALPLGPNNVLMATDVVSTMPSALRMGNNFYVMLDTESADEAQTLFDALSTGGQIEMPLQKTEWAELYGSLTDRYGVQWMVNYSSDAGS